MKYMLLLAVFYLQYFWIQSVYYSIFYNSKFLTSLWIFISELSLITETSSSSLISSFQNVKLSISTFELVFIHLSGSGSSISKFGSQEDLFLLKIISRTARLVIIFCTVCSFSLFIHFWLQFLHFSKQFKFYWVTYQYKNKNLLFDDKIGSYWIFDRSISGIIDLLSWFLFICSWISLNFSSFIPCE